MIAVVLPGMNGTAALLDEFVAALAPEFQAIVISYPARIPLGYDELVARVLAALPESVRYILIAESFSGPIAIRIAASRPAGLAGIVLCATFAKSPSRLLRWLSPLIRMFSADLLPVSLSMPLTMGRWLTGAWLKRIKADLGSLDNEVVGCRLQAIAGVDVSDQLGAIESPALYLRAAKDRLIARESGQLILNSVPNVILEEIEGPHFLLQAVPDQCATAIKKHF